MHISSYNFSSCYAICYIDKEGCETCLRVSNKMLMYVHSYHAGLGVYVHLNHLISGREYCDFLR